jgi:hypothetical protein
MEQMSDIYWSAQNEATQNIYWSVQDVLSLLTQFGTASDTQVAQMADTFGVSMEQFLSDMEQMSDIYWSAQNEATQNAERASENWSQVTDRANELISSIDDTLQNVKYSNLNLELPRPKAEDAQQDYAELYNAAVADGAGVSEVQEYLGFVSTYLQQSQDAYKSSGQYQQIYESAIEDMQTVRDRAEAGSYDEAIYNEISGKSPSPSGTTGLLDETTGLLDELVNGAGFLIGINTDNLSASAIDFLTGLATIVSKYGWESDVTIDFITNNAQWDTATYDEFEEIVTKIG